MTLTRNYIILIIGGVLLLGGYTLFEIATSYMMVEWRDTNVIFKDEVSIQPAENFSTSHIIKEDIMVDVNLQSFPPDNQIQVQIIDDQGSSMFDITVKKQLVVGFETESEGLHTIIVSNLEQEEILVKIELQDVPHRNQKGVLGFDNITQIKTGLIMMVGGVVVLAIGSFVFLHKRKKKNNE